MAAAFSFLRPEWNPHGEQSFTGGILETGKAGWIGIEDLVGCYAHC